MNKSISVTLEKFTTVARYTDKKYKPRACSLEIKLSFDGNEHFIEECWLDETIDFYAIADKYNFLDKLLEEALVQLKLDKESAKNERSYLENLD